MVLSNCLPGLGRNDIERARLAALEFVENPRCLLCRKLKLFLNARAAAGSAWTAPGSGGHSGMEKFADF